MTSTEPGPADDTAVSQSVGAGEGLETSQPAGGGHEREVGVTAAVERSGAELSDEGDPVPEHPHAGADDREPARSTDDL